MKQMKKLTSLLLALVMCLGMLPTAAWAVGSTVTEVVPCTREYAYVHEFSEGYATIVKMVNGNLRCGIVDPTGKEIILEKYNDISDFSNGVVAVNVPVYAPGEGGLISFNWGFIDATGKEVIPCKFQDYHPTFHEGLAAAHNEDYKWGFIDNTGKVIIPYRYEAVRGFTNGFAAVQDENKNWGFIDKTGTEVIPCKYNDVGTFSDGIAAVQVGISQDGGRTVTYKWGYIDTTGKEVTACKYELAGDFSEGFGAVRLNRKWGFVDKAGNEVIPCTYGGYDEPKFSEGLAAVQFANRKMGYIDTTGKEVIAGKYDTAREFSDGLAAVLDENNRWGFIDTAGKEVVPCKYNRVENFEDGLAAVCHDDKWGFIDKTGNEVVPCRYDCDWPPQFHDGLAAVGYDTGDEDEWGNKIFQWGFVDRNGKEVVPRKYEDVVGFSDGLAWVKLDGKWGILAVTAGSPAPTTGTAAENVQTVKVDGKDVSFAMYSPDNGGTNYVRLVDLAVALKGTAGQFNVGYDGKVLLTTGVAYTGAASTAPFHSEMEYVTLDESTYVNGVAKNMEAIRFEYNGGGYTYYKLRDLGKALGFNVGWDNVNQRVFLETDKAYTNVD